MTEDFASGIKIISEMSKEEIVDELTAHWRSELMGKDMTELKKMVIGQRIHSIEERMIKEAGLVAHRGIFGTHLHEEGEERE